MLQVQERVRKLSEPDPNSGCWLWTGRLCKDGYSRMKKGRTQYPGHRISYAAFVGDPGSKLVCHKCDTPACVNPDHLFLGTHKENVRDMTDKGRSGRGGGGSPRLSADDVCQIIMRYEGGETVLALGKDFSVTSASIRHRLKKAGVWTSRALRPVGPLHHALSPVAGGGEK